MGHLAREQTQEETAAALASAMKPHPSVQTPNWTRPLLQTPELIGRLGEMVTVNWPPGDPSGVPLAKEHAGLAALAIALCRNPESAQAVALELDPTAGQELLYKTQLAQSLVQPGDPSRMRRQLKTQIALLLES